MNISKKYGVGSRWSSVGNVHLLRSKMCIYPFSTDLSWCLHLFSMILFQCKAGREIEIEKVDLGE